ncbi:hypothetical protein [Arthrobacter sp. CAN_A1]|uniref:hypothetical protein n=1 Tax=Arthrobacter sp. CAN_A1 TaxID=2787717 RepID=UPI0018C9BDD4
MIDDLLRPPETPWAVAADGVRGAALLSVIAVLLWWGPVEFAVLFLVLGGVLLSRMIPVDSRIDTAYGVVLLVAAWSAVTDLYEVVSWWDLAIHTVATAAIAPIAYLLLLRMGYLPRPEATRRAATGVTILTLALGLSLSVVWEFAEWGGNRYITNEINVGYEDTLGDIAVGGLGSLASGVLLASVLTRRRNRISVNAS